MPMPTFSWDLPLETRDGDPAELVSILPGVIEGNRPVIARVLRNGASAWSVHTYRTDGTRDGKSSANGLDLVNKVDRLELWLNVRPVDGAFATMGIAYPTRVLADQNSMSDRTACVRVTYVAGEGLENGNGAPRKVETHTLTIDELPAMTHMLGLDAVPDAVSAWDTQPIYTRAGLYKAILAERERCAKIVEDHGRKNREYKQEINVARAELALVAAHNIRNPAGAAEVDLRNISSLEIKTQVPRIAIATIHDNAWKSATHQAQNWLAEHVTNGTKIAHRLGKFLNEINEKWPLMVAQSYSGMPEGINWTRIPYSEARSKFTYPAGMVEALKSTIDRGAREDSLIAIGWNKAIDAAISVVDIPGQISRVETRSRILALRRSDLQEPTKVDPYEYSAAIQEATKRRVEGEPMRDAAIEMALDEITIREGNQGPTPPEYFQALKEMAKGVNLEARGWNNALGAVTNLFDVREHAHQPGGQNRLVSREDVLALRKPFDEVRPLVDHLDYWRSAGMQPHPLQDPNVHPLVHAAAACARNEKPQDPVGDIAIAVKIGWNDALDAAIVKLNAWGHVFTRQAFADTLSTMRYPIENQAYRQPRPELLHALRDIGLRLTRSAVARDQQPPLPIQEGTKPVDVITEGTRIPVDLVDYTYGWNDACNRILSIIALSSKNLTRDEATTIVGEEIKPTPPREIAGKPSQYGISAENKHIHAQIRVTQRKIMMLANDVWSACLLWVDMDLKQAGQGVAAEIVHMHGVNWQVREGVLGELVKKTSEEWHAAADR